MNYHCAWCGRLILDIESAFNEGGETLWCDKPCHDEHMDELAAEQGPDDYGDPSYYP